jgi:hypothetical protein
MEEVIMKHNYRWLIIVFLIPAALFLVACGQAAGAEAAKPAHLEEIEGSEFKQVVLTEKAVERTDIQTAQVSGKQGELVVPYSSVIYGLNGETWLYTNPEPLTYVRQAITVDHIDDDLAFLSEGPEPGTAVVTVGVIELYGEESGIKK